MEMPGARSKCPEMRNPAWRYSCSAVFWASRMRFLNVRCRRRCSSFRRRRACRLPSTQSDRQTVSRLTRWNSLKIASRSSFLLMWCSKRMQKILSILASGRPIWNTDVWKHLNLLTISGSWNLVAVSSMCGLLSAAYRILFGSAASSDQNRPAPQGMSRILWGWPASRSPFLAMACSRQLVRRRRKPCRCFRK